MKPIVRSPLARAWLKFVMGHVAFLVAEMPGRIAHARSHDELAALQDILKLARNRRVAKS